MSSRKFLWTLVPLLAITFRALGQNPDAEVTERVRMLEEGKAGQVKADLLSLVARYQNHPGVLYLQGRLAANGVEAAKYYESVVDNFPRSEWADDALYRIYLYYYSLGLVRTAGLKMLQIREEYPNSVYARLKTPVVAQDTQMVFQPQIIDTPRMSQPKIVGTPMQTSFGSYTIQVGAFSSIDNAKRLKAFFEELGYSVDVQNKVRGGRSLYLVWVGNFATADEARKFGAEVKTKHKIESIVVVK